MFGWSANEFGRVLAAREGRILLDEADGEVRREGDHDDRVEIGTATRRFPVVGSPSADLSFALS